MKKSIFLCFVIFMCTQCKKDNHNNQRITNEDHVVYFCEELSSTESQLVSYDIDNAEKIVLLKNLGYISLESSPIGNKVVLVQENVDHTTDKILLFDLQTKTVKVVYTTDSTIQISYCNLTADLKHIYFAEHQSDNLYHMYLSIIDTSGNNYKNLDDCNYFLQSPHEIPGYNQIAYVHQTYLSFHNEVRLLKRVDFTGNNKLALDTALYYDNEIDVYNNKITYVVLDHGVILKTINSDGSNKQVIKTDTNRILYPKFNNNGTSITYYSITFTAPYTTFVNVTGTDGNDIRSIGFNYSIGVPYFGYSNDGMFLVMSNPGAPGQIHINDGTTGNTLISNKLASVYGLIPGAYFKKNI